MKPASASALMAALLAAFMLLATACSSKQEGIPTPPAQDQAPSSVYAQGGNTLPTEGITVTDEKSLDEQVQEGIDELDDYGEDSTPAVYDPWEHGWNRFWFGFNDWVYVKVAAPVYSAWETVIPKEFRAGLHNFYRNACFPWRFVNNLLQGKFFGAGVEFSAFILNTSAGFGGLFDIAKGKKTIVPVHPEGEDFGQTLAVWGFGHGPYIVWPFLGPSSVRETFGRIGDVFAKPAFMAGYVIKPWWLPPASQYLLEWNDLDELLPAYMSIRGAAVDPYIMLREAYIRNRANMADR